MTRACWKTSVATSLATLWAGVLGAALPASAQDSKPVYRCPGNPVLYTDALTAKEAISRGCRTLEGSPITVIQSPSPKPRPAAAAPAPSTGPSASRPDTRINPDEQRARDTDAKRILEAELSKEEERLGQLKKEFNNGEPERQGDERNYQKYLDRVAEMRSAIARKEADIAAIKREIGKIK
jgi:hypothetical protein